MSGAVTAGLHVGEYQLDEPLGQGGFGEIWKAHHRAFRDDVVAIKFPSDQTDLQALRREGDLQHRVTHPGVVRCLGMDLEAAPPYVVLEYLSGGTLRERLRAGPLPWQEAASLCLEILTILEAAHAEDVVHLDLKPENILFTADGRPKLTDFGLSRSLSDLQTSLVFSGQAAPEVAGSLAYMAPEQRKGEPTDATTDLFALGAILFEMVTAELPLGAEGLRELAPQVPPALEAVFRGAFTRRERRFPSARAMRDALDAAVRPSAAPAPPRQPAVPLTAQLWLSHQPPPLPQYRLAPPPPYGYRLPARLRAGFLERLLAVFVDGLLGVLGAVILYMFVVRSGMRTSVDLALLALPCAYVVYRWLLQGLLGGTLGQLMTGLRVRRFVDGQPIGLGLSLVRTISFVIAFATMFGPLLASLSAKRGLHDYMAGTFVQRV